MFLPSFSDFLTHGQVAFTVAAAIAFGINMATTIVSPYLTNIGLMTFGRLRTIALSVAVGVLVTLVALILVEALAPDFAVWALVSGNLLVTVWQYLSLRAPSAASSERRGAATARGVAERVEPVPAAVP